MFKVIIAGGRDFADYELLKQTLDLFLKDKIDVAIVSGAAKGADKLGEKYAKERNIPILSYPANWDKYGKSAGYIRNKEMAINADALVAFWDQTSKGTKDMIDLGYKHKLEVTVISY
jgi:putative cell wall-binding protein